MGLTQVSTDGVKNDAITKTKIPANQIEASELADNAVDTNAIANNAVTAGKLASGVQTTINNNADNRVITGDANANTLNGESSVVIDANGKVGIGTTSPLNTLHCHGDGTLRISPSAGVNQFESGRLRFTENTSDFQGAYIHYNGSGNILNIGTHPANDTVAGNDLNAISIPRDSGNVGIGTTSPAKKLDINGEIRASSGILFGTDTAAANALDDYEEGTWTPDLRFGNSSSGMSYSVQSGTYTKIGNTVHYRFRITLSNKGSSTGHAQVFGLPFVAHTSNSGGYVCFAAGLTNSSRWSANQTPTIDTNNTYVYLRYVITGIDYSSNHNNASMTNSTDLILAGHYITSS